jgi:hypothetical protein
MVLTIKGTENTDFILFEAYSSASDPYIALQLTHATDTKN